MNQFAVHGATAGWLLGKTNLVDALHSLLMDDEPLKPNGKTTVFSQGGLRIGVVSDGSLSAIWNADYVSSEGDNAWGMIDVTVGSGLAGAPSIGRESFERALYIISQRSLGLLIDGAFIHRSWQNGAHTCLAGRGSEARQLSLGYIDKNIKISAGSFRAIAITGPEWNLEALSNRAAAVEAALPELIHRVQEMCGAPATVPMSGIGLFARIGEILEGMSGRPLTNSEFESVSVATQNAEIPTADRFRTASWTYNQWLAPNSPISAEQRRLVESQALMRHPVRITGPAGSGKTLLMQLLAIWRLQCAQVAGHPARVLFLVHNQKMADMVRHRFDVLLDDQPELRSRGRELRVITLSGYAREELDLEINQVIDADAQAAKEFQMQILGEAMDAVLGAHADEAAASDLFREIQQNRALEPTLRRMLMAEISIAIKGHGLQSDGKRYIESERPLSRLHGMMSVRERGLIFQIFSAYHNMMFEGWGVLDSDDVALSLLGRLRTPIWQLRRKDVGYDHVFVDETQLFNENERKVLSLLTRSAVSYVPIVIALDDAQEVYGQVASGLAALGIENAASESLTAVHRSTAPIVRLAFFVIQKSTDLFGPDFPDFTSPEIADSAVDEVDELPRVERIPQTQPSLGRFVLNKIRTLRKQNLRRVAVVCLAEQYWTLLLGDLRASDLPLHVLEQRGERLPMVDPVVVLSRPAHIGGQEFDAVLLVGAEAGLAPPRVVDNEALAAAVEQQTLRELYVSITRARKQVAVLIGHGANPSPVLADAIGAGHLVL